MVGRLVGICLQVFGVIKRCPRLSPHRSLWPGLGSTISENHFTDLERGSTENRKSYAVGLERRIQNDGTGADNELSVFVGLRTYCTCTCERVIHVLNFCASARGMPTMPACVCASGPSLSFPPPWPQMTTTRLVGCRCLRFLNVSAIHPIPSVVPNERKKLWQQKPLERPET